MRLIQLLLSVQIAFAGAQVTGKLRKCVAMFIFFVAAKFTSYFMFLKPHNMVALNSYERYVDLNLDSGERFSYGEYGAAPFHSKT